MNTNRDLTEVTGFIYKITAPNGAVYIGQTINIYKRKHSYKKGAFAKQTKLWNSCQKYNWNPIDTFEVIEECICGKDKELINDREIHWIEFFDSFKNGLNCTEGGKGQLSKIWTEEERENQRQLTLRNGTGFIKGHKINEGKILSEEIKEKIRNASKEYFSVNEHWHKGTTLSEEIKQKISESVSGEKNGFYGKKHTEESREKMKLARSKQIISEETKMKISKSNLLRDKSNDRKHIVSVCQYDMDGNFIKKYDSIKEASESTGTMTTSIIRVCKGRRKSSNNFIWKYSLNI